MWFVSLSTRQICVKYLTIWEIKHRFAHSLSMHTYISPSHFQQGKLIHGFRRDRVRGRRKGGGKCEKKWHGSVKRRRESDLEEWLEAFVVGDGWDHIRGNPLLSFPSLRTHKSLCMKNYQIVGTPSGWQGEEKTTPFRRVSTVWHH